MVGIGNQERRSEKWPCTMMLKPGLQKKVYQCSLLPPCFLSAFLLLHLVAFSYWAYCAGALEKADLAAPVSVGSGKVSVTLRLHLSWPGLTVPCLVPLRRLARSTQCVLLSGWMQGELCHKKYGFEGASRRCGVFHEGETQLAVQSSSAPNEQ